MEGDQEDHAQQETGQDQTRVGVNLLLDGRGQHASGGDDGGDGQLCSQQTVHLSQEPQPDGFGGVRDVVVVGEVVPNAAAARFLILDADTVKVLHEGHLNCRLIHYLSFNLRK